MDTTESSNSAAVLMMLLGEDLAATVMRYLEEDEVAQLSSAMSNVDGKQADYIDRLEEMLNEYESTQAYPPIS